MSKNITTNLENENSSIVKQDNTITDNSEQMNLKIKKYKKDKIKKILKKSTCYIAILFASFVLSIVTLCMNNSFENDFIAPTSNEIYGQKGELYVVSTYIGTDASSKTFVKELRKLESEYNIPYYLIDIVEYEELVDIWELEYSPTYFVIHKNGDNKELLYKSYGAKKYNVLNAEIEYCKLNGGVPIDQRNKEHDDDVTGLKMTLKTVETNANNNVNVTFSIVNKGSSEVTFKNSFIRAYSYNSSNTGSILDSSSSTKIGVGETQEVTVTFSGVEALKIKLIIDLSSLGGSSYSWIINKLSSSATSD